MTYSTPFFAINDEDAKRAFGTAVTTPGENDLFLHSEDFTLYRVGVFDDSPEEGEIIITEYPTCFLCTGAIFKTPLGEK